MIDQLTETLKDSENIPSQKQDFRKLQVSYICTAGVDEESFCIYYSPGLSGNCSLQKLPSRTCLYTNGDSS